MKTFGSCHLIINRQPTMICDFIDADFFHWEGISTPFFKWIPSTNTNNFSCSFRENFKYFYC